MNNITAMMQLSTTKKNNGKIKRDKFAVFQLDNGYMVVENSYDSRYDFEFMDYFTTVKNMDVVNRMMQNWLRDHLDGYFTSHDYELRSKRRGEYPDILYREQIDEKNVREIYLKFRKDVSEGQMNDCEWTLKERMNEVLSSDVVLLERTAV